MDAKTSAQLAAEKAVAVLGGPVAAARLLNVKDQRHQTVQSWLKNRVPAEYCPAIERETKAKGAPVLCEELRPDIPWMVLREQADRRQEHDLASRIPLEKGSASPVTAAKQTTTASDAPTASKAPIAIDNRAHMDHPVMAPSLIGHGGDLNERKPSVGASERPTTPKER
jgi:DNA-binding transcriptional regulator YdaS (Cro superfamily)